MKRYFIDTNVILDALLHRVDHDPSSAGKLLEAGEQRHVRLLTTSVSIANVLYQYQRNRTSKKGLGLIRARGVRSDLLACVDVVPMDASHFQQVLASTFGDIEDGSQYFAVAAAGPIDAVVSRDEDYDGHIGVPALQPVRLCARSNTNSQYRSTRSTCSLFRTTSPRRSSRSYGYATTSSDRPANVSSRRRGK